MKTSEHNFKGLQPFHMSIKHVTIDSHSPLNQFDSHVHSECEIYVNLSGDVSFMVEDRIYPVTRGCAIITRPYEYHHCVYHSDAIHEHFWILFSSNGNEQLLDVFFDRTPGSDNLIFPPSDRPEAIIDMCFEMMSQPESEMQRYAQFLRLISLLTSGQKLPEIQTDDIPHDVRTALCYIGAHLSEKITVASLAEMTYVSVNTLERHFYQTLQMSPREYIKKKRLTYAAEQLQKGMSVWKTCEKSGFSDYSHFIKQFKDYFGMTPLKYRAKSR